MTRATEIQIDQAAGASGCDTTRIVLTRFSPRVVQVTAPWKHRAPARFEDSERIEHACRLLRHPAFSPVIGRVILAIVGTTFLAGLSAPLLVAADPGTSRQPAGPNFVIIYTDDGPADVSRLKKEGMQFPRWECSSPLCSPSRYGLQSGCYASRAP